MPAPGSGGVTVDNVGLFLTKVSLAKAKEIKCIKSVLNDIGCNKKIKCIILHMHYDKTEMYLYGELKYECCSKDNASWQLNEFNKRRTENHAEK